MYQLQVRVVSGNNLPVGDLNGFSDPYVKLFWGGQTVKTSTKKKTLNPYWNETFTLTSSLATEPLKVSCYDWDRFTRDDVLGTGEVRTDDLINKTEKSVPFPSRKHWRAHGELPVTVHLSPRGEIQLRLTALNFPEHFGNTAGATTYTTTSYVPMGGGGTVDDMLKQRFSMGYNSGAAPYTSGLAPYGSGAPQGPPSYYPPPQSQAPPASYYPTPQQPTYPTSYMPTGGGAPSSYLPGGYGGPPTGGYGTGGAPPPVGSYGGGYGGPPGGGYGAPPASGYGGQPGGYGGPPPAGGGYGGPPGGGYGTGGAPYGGAPPPGGGYPPQQYPPTGY